MPDRNQLKQDVSRVFTADTMTGAANLENAIRCRIDNKMANKMLCEYRVSNSVGSLQRGPQAIRQRQRTVDLGIGQAASFDIVPQ
jgi:hypothetical protein